MKLYVVKNRKHSLLGRQWLKELKIDVNEKLVKKNNVNCIVSKSNVLNNLRCKYPEVFSTELGKIPNYFAKLTLKETTTHRFFKH